MATSKQGSTRDYDPELIRSCLLLLAIWRKLYRRIRSSGPHSLTAALAHICSVDILFFVPPSFTFLRLQSEQGIMLRAWCECCQITCYSCSQPQKDLKIRDYPLFICFLNLSF